MKQVFFTTILAVLMSFQIVFAQKTEDKKKDDGYKFTEKFRIPHTSVKDQYRSGTCWSFSALSFIEAEMIRMGREKVDLSEMFIVNHCYKDKAEKYVRVQGSLNFGGGGAFHDAAYVIEKYGIVPEEVYTGLNYGTKKHVHGELDKVLKEFIKAVVENKNKELSTAWKPAFDAITDAYFGKLPEKFNYKGKEYTPRTFADDFTGIKTDRYVEISSFTHHPFYSKFILEIPDNWLWNEVYNVPLKELTEIIDFSLNRGYTVAWAADVSHKGFAYKKGVAVIPDVVVENSAGLEKAKWEKLTKREKENLVFSFDKPVKEKIITQEMRQKAFDNYNTTDDHGMLLVGIAHDQNGSKFYIVKNSWNTGGKYKGYFYVSEAFILMQTTNIMVHKNAVLDKIKKKLDI